MRVAAILAAIALPLYAGPNPEPDRLRSFQLPDQFGTRHHLEFPRKTPLLLLVGDRKGSEEVDAWIPPLKERWAAVADIAGIADVSAAPRFLRNRILEGIRAQRPRPLMLDFDGQVTDPLRLASKTANVLVVDASGRIVARITGKPDTARLAQVGAALTPLLPAPAAAEPR
jgi:hypothetical protein